MSDRPLATHELPGYIVLGVSTEDGAPRPRKVPVLSSSAQGAVILAADGCADFQPIGVMSETELREHLKAIEDHRSAMAKGARS